LLLLFVAYRVVFYKNIFNFFFNHNLLYGNLFMSKSLFVAGLDYSITSDELKAMFEPFGTVESAKVISDKFTGQSKGFGFVDMSSQQEADECMKELHDSMQKNRQIIVKEKDENAGARKSFGGGGRSGGGGGGFSRR
jgi:RNA recognition motif-containing protein